MATSAARVSMIHADIGSTWTDEEQTTAAGLERLVYNGNCH